MQVARVRLTVDLEAELELAELTEGLWTREPDGELAAAIRARIAPGDVLLPSLGDHVAGPIAFSQVQVPAHADELAEFAARVHALRRARKDRWPADVPTGELPEHGGRVKELADRLGDLGEQRWQLATTTPLLIGLWDRAVAVKEAPDALTLAVVASLAAFRGLPLTNADLLLEDIDDLLYVVYRRARVHVVEADRSELARSILASEQHTDASRGTESSDVRTVLLYVHSPDPLTLLIRRALGLPDDESER